MGAVGWGWGVGVGGGQGKDRAGTGGGGGDRVTQAPSLHRSTRGGLHELFAHLWILSTNTMVRLPEVDTSFLAFSITSRTSFTCQGGADGAGHMCGTGSARHAHHRAAPPIFFATLTTPLPSFSVASSERNGKCRVPAPPASNTHRRRYGAEGYELGGRRPCDNVCEGGLPAARRAPKDDRGQLVCS